MAKKPHLDKETCLKTKFFMIKAVVGSKTNHQTAAMQPLDNSRSPND